MPGRCTGTRNTEKPPEFPESKGARHDQAAARPRNPSGVRQGHHLGERDAKRPAYNVTVQRLYKDGDQWKQATNFGRNDLPLVAKVADLAHTWIFEQKASAVAS